MKKISNKGGILINNFPSSQPLLYQNNSSFTYEELNTKLVEESPKYDIWGLLSNIGGTLGTDFTKFYPIQFDITVLIPYRKKNVSHRMSHPVWGISSYLPLCEDVGLRSP